ncbi:MAG TPA: DNA-processing protein DprA [Burkholderiaceae bacterium]|nr:DNA-processing protein DprA [Burkholderiaceae bacterium]
MNNTSEPTDLHIDALQERAAWLRLSLTPGIGPATTRELLKHFGLPTAIFSAPLSALKPVVSAELARVLLSEPAPGIARAIAITHDWIAQDARHFVLTWADEDYPPLLLATTDPPPVLYGVGERALLGAPMLAMVGARSSTRQGGNTASAFAEHLAHAGLTLVSGMARGIDAAAHEGALKARAEGARASTVAVIGTGIDVVYPNAHRHLDARIREHGLLLSEYALGTPPMPHNFPRRNRIIAGLARGVLVVEAALRSGSLITARLAVELGREVFAIPGSIHSPLARGCHRLIRDGAKLVESAQDILEELRIDASPQDLSSGRSATPSAAGPTPPPQLAQLFNALGHDPVDIDVLTQRTGLEAGSLIAALFELEMAHCVERLPGNRYQRLH